MGDELQPLVFLMIVLVNSAEQANQALQHTPALYKGAARLKPKTLTPHQRLAMISMHRMHLWHLLNAFVVTSLLTGCAARYATISERPPMFQSGSSTNGTPSAVEQR